MAVLLRVVDVGPWLTVPATVAAVGAVAAAVHEVRLLRAAGSGWT